MLEVAGRSRLGRQLLGGEVVGKLERSFQFELEGKIFEAIVYPGDAVTLNEYVEKNKEEI